MNATKKIELLAPAGNLEKLEIAINYGADAVYLAGKKFNLRNFSDNFSLKKMDLARYITYKNNVKMYVAINTYSRNKENTAIIKYLENLKLINPDALIISDPAIFLIAKEIVPNIPIHISTQSNTTNTRTALFWKNLGAKRINTARELTLEEIKEIASVSKIEVEVFVHGSMCIAYSGRCLLSNFMSQRESNQGKCCQPCRFEYTVMEKKRPGEYFPIYEDESGSYIFSSKDLCMIDYIDTLINAGISSLKIEGRMKSINYVATTTKVYREAIDYYYNKFSLLSYNSLKKNWYQQLKGLSNREYSTGFFFKNPKKITSNLNGKIFNSDIFIAKVIKATTNHKTFINVRNKFFLKDKIKILSPLSPIEQHDEIKEIISIDGVKCNFAQPGSNVYIKLKNNCYALDLLKRPIKN